jgi:hypothetical protein
VIEYYDKQGNPLTYEQYRDLLQTIGPEYKRVASTQVGDVWISTVWLGLDHQYGDGPPLIFETMQFDDDTAGDYERWSTLEEAQAGHEAWVKRITGA